MAGGGTRLGATVPHGEGLPKGLPAGSNVVGGQSRVAVSVVKKDRGWGPREEMVWWMVLRLDPGLCANTEVRR